MSDAAAKANKRKINFYLLYRSITQDFLFIYAIDSIYYSEIKNMSFSTISLIATIIAISFAVLSVPMVRVVRKIGTVRASQLGTLCFVISALMTFFDPWVIMLSQVFTALGFALKGPAESKILKDNLKMYGLSENYAKYVSIVKFIYGIISAGAAIGAGFLYNVWPYAPLVVCLSIMAVGLVMSFFIKNEKEIYKKQNNLPAHNVGYEKHEFFKLFKYHTTWILVFFSMFFMIVIACTMDINKMAFQELSFSALTITIVVTIARVFRAFTALGFNYVYKKLKFKSVYIIIGVLTVGVVMVGLGGLLTTGTTALVIMGIGSTLLYCTRDPFNIFREDFVMNSKGLTKRQTLLSITNVGEYLGRCIISFSISRMLLSQSVALTNIIIVSVFVPLILIMSLLLDRKKRINKY